MLHEYDVVVLKQALPGTSVPVSSEGTIVMVHSVEGQAYEVEFFDQNHETIDVCTGTGDEYLELKGAFKDSK